MNKIYLPGWEKPVINAAKWLRQQKNIPDYESIESIFGEYFGCEILVEPVTPLTGMRVYAVFDKPEAAMFLLRWS